MTILARQLGHLPQRDWTSMRQCQPGHAFWNCNELLLWTVPSESASFLRCFPCTNKFVFLHTFCDYKHLFSSFESVFGWLRGATVFLSLPSEQNTSCHLLTVVCEKAFDPTTCTFLCVCLCVWNISVPSTSFSRAKTWKRSLCLLKFSIFRQSANSWFKWRRINQWRMTRITYWFQLSTGEIWHFLHI